MARAILRTIICLLIAGIAGAQSPPITILTSTDLGFKEASSTYTLSMPALKFESVFGPPEIKKKNSGDFGYVGNSIGWDYINDGISLLINHDGTIRCISFKLLGSKTVKACRAKTDRGIGRGSALRTVLKTYGDPYRHHAFKQGGLDDLDLYYKFGDNYLSFTFDHGILTDISLRADFQHFMDLLSTP